MKMIAFAPVLVLITMGVSSCSTQTATTARDATVTMRDGTQFSGALTESSANEVKVTGIDGSAHTVPMAQVRTIEYADTPPVAAAPAVATTAKPTAPAAIRPPAPKPVRVHEEHYHPTPEVISTKTYLVPVGAELSLRMEETINSDTAAEGQTFAAELTHDVLDAEGNVVIPDGSNAQIVVKSASKGGRFHGASDLLLDMQSVSVGGKRYQVSAVDIERKGRESVGVNKRTAVFTGAGAAIGAVIGALGGGGKGAAIGAASGAGAGAVAQVITSGNSIRVPVETILTFRLDQALKVTAR
ncbi:MAG: hypothetical protein ABIR70_06600 [Bryobacteraceae bacterium]